MEVTCLTPCDDAKDIQQKQLIDLLPPEITNQIASYITWPIDPACFRSARRIQAWFRGALIRRPRRKVCCLCRSEHMVGPLTIRTFYWVCDECIASGEEQVMNNPNRVELHYDDDGYDVNGLDRNEFDREGYDTYGYDIHGYNCQGVHYTEDEFRNYVDEGDQDQEIDYYGDRGIDY